MIEDRKIFFFRETEDLSLCRPGPDLRVLLVLDGVQLLQAGKSAAQPAFVDAT